MSLDETSKRVERVQSCSFVILIMGNHRVLQEYINPWRATPTHLIYQAPPFKDPPPLISLPRDQVSSIRITERYTQSVVKSRLVQVRKLDMVPVNMYVVCMNGVVCMFVVCMNGVCT